jgi:hypothetical protein
LLLHTGSPGDVVVKEVLQGGHGMRFFVLRVLGHPGILPS